MTYWVRERDGVPEAFQLYRRHYSSAKNPNPKQRQFVGPGESIVLSGFFCSALFVWRKERYRLDKQTGVNCSVFRNESNHLSSEMILEAEKFAVEKWGNTRAFTMIKPDAIRSSNPGCCFKKAGWETAGKTKRGLVILEKYL